MFFVSYSNRVNAVLASSSRGRQYKLPMPNGVSAPQIVLASQPISTADIDMVCSAEPFYVMIIPPANFVCGGVYCFHVVRACVRVCVCLCVCLSVHPSVRNVLFP